ncbi:hypothetical protein DMN91_010688 [Ooceraea biroi]|uniref:Odorant receptor n=1 Tax=Ooceraea biroi TaxID=2015173 RepID=A0A3L8D800_OOCBI|nr:hypothetical protein DMN91_010688 [Ooceraea biroi]
MEFTRSHFCGITKKVLVLTGQWPYQNRRNRLLGVTVTSIATFSLIIPQVSKIFQCGKNVQCILQVLPTICLFTIIIVKLYACHFNASRIKYLTDHLLDDWKKLESPEEYKIMKAYAANGRLFALIFMLWCYIISPVFVSISLIPQILDLIAPLNESRPILLPYEAYYFVDEEEYFFYIFFHAVVALEIAITGLLAHDCMLLTYVQHVCSIFAIAGFRFENIAYKNVNVTNLNNLDNYYNKKIVISVNAHWRALDFADLLENTFTITFLIQIVIVIIGMSITLLQISMQSDVLQATRYSAFVVGQLIHLFFFNVQGQKLVNHSLQIRDKIYNSSWFKIPVKSQMLLLYVMRKSLQPNFISAGKIYIFCLKSFTACSRLQVVQTSVSYFTVFASFQ